MAEFFHNNGSANNPVVFDYKMEPGDDRTFDDRDSAPLPKCVVVDLGFDWQAEAARQNVHWDETIVYETHVKGFSNKHPEVPEHLQGTYAGFVSPKLVEYLTSLWPEASSIAAVKDMSILQRFCWFGVVRSLSLIYPDDGMRPGQRAGATWI